MKQKPNRKNRFRIEKVEERIAPGTLTIRPPGVVNQDYDLIVPDAANQGLDTAELHTNGVITWTPDA